MNINELQKKINEIDSKLKSLNLVVFYDEDYNYMVKYNDKNYRINLINEIEDINEKKNTQQEALNICINNKNNLNNVIYESDLDMLIDYKKIYDFKTFSIIRDFVIFDKSNDLFFKILELISNIKNEKVIKKNENFERKLSSKDIIELLKTEFEEKYQFSKERKYYISNDKKIAVLSLYSKRYDRPSYKYWYTFHNYQREVLDKYIHSYIMFYFDDKNEYVLINTNKLYPYLEKLGKTQHGDSIGWHIHIQEKSGKYQIRLPKIGLLDIKNSEDKLKEQNKEEFVIDISSGDFKVIKY